MSVRRFPPKLEPPVEAPPEPVQARWRILMQQYRGQIQRGALFASGVVVALLAVILYQLLTPAPRALTARDVGDSIAQALASVTPLPAFSEQVYRVIQPSLVLIQARGEGDEGSVGSGVIVSDEGDILTSLHVVTGSREILLTFADGTESPGEITASQPENDIAVLRASKLPGELVPAVLGNPGAHRVGDEAFVVGNPFGLYGSMSAGVISGFGRKFKPVGGDYELQDLIQIDAAVNPGNSGGPLLNRYGEVIGIVTGLVNPTEENFFVGVAFAVPITTAGSAVGTPDY